ncbi:helix-turn-helix domain-containing protein [Allofournierella sp.]|uniref:helix-turn-helix domain-containing protein n=1 Tax=Allofournierella sp. TaxID=1940256 RepID=UPI003AB17EBD
MNERTFGERLKACRAQRRYTQQQLADRLGVSDKTVSKWECGGGYPDVGVLVPLARALGVTVDELLDGQNPLRQLQKQDWQNFLAFAFSLGGGLLCFLVATFAPALLGYLLYLGCLAYGAYLQKYYCYKTRWFTLTGVGMLAFVHVSLAFRLVMLFYPLGLMGQVSWLEGMGRSTEFTALFLRLLWPALAALVLAAVLTAAGAVLLRRYLAGQGQSPCLRLRLGRPRPAQLWPCAAFALQAGFVALYAGVGLPGFVYIHQTALFWALTLACGLGLAAFYGPRRQWANLARALAVLPAGRLILATGAQGAYNMRDGHLLAPALFSPEISVDIYAVYQKPAPQMAVFAALVLAVYLALCCVRVWDRKPGSEKEPQGL